MWRVVHQQPTTEWRTRKHNFSDSSDNSSNNRNNAMKLPLLEQMSPTSTEESSNLNFLCQRRHRKVVEDVAGLASSVWCIKVLLVVALILSCVLMVLVWVRQTGSQPSGSPYLLNCGRVFED